MSLTVFGWLLIVASIALSMRLFLSSQTRGSLTEKLGRSRLQSLSASVGPSLRRSAWPLSAAGAVFVLVAGIGAGASYLKESRETSGAEQTDGEVLTRLEDYAHAVSTEEPAAEKESEKLPDVNSMTEKLAARLKAAPDDVKGWRMLGWSYFNTERYQDAADAYGKAIALDPDSAELKLAYEEAKKKADSAKSSETALPMQAGPVDKEAANSGGDEIAKADAVPPHETDSAIRAMVDGLAARLEKSPRDVEGWARLMRSRVVLGEQEVAKTAFHKALDVFKDDSTASSRLTEAAVELGLKAE